MIFLYVRSIRFIPYKTMYKTLFNNHFDTGIIQINENECENILNTINLRLFVVKLSYFIFPIFKVDIGVKWPILLCPWLTESGKRKIVEGHSTMPVHQERSTYPPGDHYGDVGPMSFAPLATKDRRGGGYMQSHSRERWLESLK